jgi:hypothetical protein
MAGLALSSYTAALDIHHQSRPPAGESHRSRSWPLDADPRCTRLHRYWWGSIRRVGSVRSTNGPLSPSPETQSFKPLHSDECDPIVEPCDVHFPGSEFDSAPQPSAPP